MGLFLFKFLRAGSSKVSFFGFLFVLHEEFSICFVCSLLVFCWLVIIFWISSIGDFFDRSVVASGFLRLKTFVVI